MSRSLKKGPYIDERVVKKVLNATPAQGTIKTWSRACTITPEMIGFTFGVHNGKEFIPVYITEETVGHRLGEFSPTRKFTRHGGKMQKELESAAKQKAQDAAKAAKAEPAGGAKKK
jgi:small subunit ribosomal protein S19